MKRIHTVTIGDAKLEIQPPGLIEIIERVEAEVSQEDVKAFAEGQIDVATVLRKVPTLARWLAVRSLGGSVGEADSDDIESFVIGLTPDELFDLIDAIVVTIVPDAESAKKKLAALGSRLGLVAAE
ncbi:hypothetical protein [Agrobacterium salinitolerans]|uniref:hypothetical protein n=1 Tax=Agrobacterium salinitolerans TaxID=1183413 RepID=UPI0022B81840|nr:hypothetical protein [Agrobacterium salinitolerans]MCZ7885391.1 hypothetical protein [Agrobacterium salinitolerans]